METLEETTGRFRWNAELPIAFDGWGKMEVDLLDEETRLVIELDGGQHFANEDAYRRKDALLHEHGYFVLHSLIQDIGAQLGSKRGRCALVWDRPVFCVHQGACFTLGIP